MRSIAALCLAGLAVQAQSSQGASFPDTLGRLAVAWTYDTRESTEPFGRRGPAGLRSDAGMPAVDCILSTPGGLVIALDAETGAEAWRVDLEIRRDANYSDFANRGVALTGDRVYAATVDAGSSASTAATAISATASAHAAALT